MPASKLLRLQLLFIVHKHLPYGPKYASPKQDLVRDLCRVLLPPRSEARPYIDNDGPSPVGTEKKEDSKK